MAPLHDWAYLVTAVAGLTVVTVLTRGSFFMLPASVSLPERVERALRYAPACALAAIVTPTVLTRDHHLYLAWDNYQLWAVLAATGVFLLRRNMLVMMVVGMAVFTALRLLG